MHPTPELRWMERSVKVRVEENPGHFCGRMRDSVEVVRVLQQRWEQSFGEITPSGYPHKEWRDVPIVGTP